jgi:hypothetical protein
MNNTAILFQQASLAEASYADFTLAKQADGIYDEELVKAALITDVTHPQLKINGLQILKIATAIDSSECLRNIS